MAQRIYVQKIGKYVEFPDGMDRATIAEKIKDLISRYPTEQAPAEPETDIIGALQHGVKSIIPTAQRGFANQAAGIYNVLPFTDAADEKPQFIQRWQESAEDKLNRLHKEFTPDTFIEKVASGIAEAPGTVATFAPYAAGAAAVAAAPVAAPLGAAATLLAGAAGFGVPSFLEAYGETGDVKEGLKRGGVGAAEGAAFGIAGKAANALGLKSALAKKLAHGVGGGAVMGGSAAVQGGDPEDVAAAAATGFGLSAALARGWEGRSKIAQTLEDLELEKAKRSIALEKPGLLDQVPGYKESKLWLQEKFTNERARLEDAVNEVKAERELDLPPSADPNLLGTRNSTAAASQVRAGIEDGFYDTLDPKIKTNTSLQKMVEDARPVNKNELGNKEWFNDHETYLLAKSIIEVKNNGIDFKGFVDDPEMVIAALRRKYSPETLAKWDKVQTEMNDLGHFAVDMLQRSGEFTKEQAAQIKSRENWVSLERYFENTGDKRGSGGNVIHKLKGGSGQQMKSPYMGAVSLMERAYTRANQNYYLNSLVDILEKSADPGKYLSPVKSIKFVKGLSKKAKDGTEKKQYAAKPRERFNDAENTITFKRDGKSMSYKFEPKLYSELRKSQRYNSPKPIEILLGAPKRWATLGYTGLNPGFSLITNPIRDMFSSMLQSKDPGVLGMKHLQRLLKSSAGRAAELGEGPITESARRFRASGAPIAGPVEADMAVGLALRDKMINNSESFGISRNLIRHPLDTLRELTGMSENLNRLPEYMLMEKKYGAGTPDAHIAGMAAAKDVSLDFSRGGEYTKWANEAIPFFNAAFQGASKFGRTLKERPVSTTLNSVGMLTGPMLGLWAINKDKEWYQELPTWEKTLFAHIKVGDGPIIRIPLPFEWGILFGSLPVAMADSIYQKDPQRLKAGIDQSLKTLIPDFVPQAVKPIAEVWAGEDLFKGRKIESESMKRMLPEERYRETTPSLYKGVGSALGVSPLKVQHLAESYSGGLIKEPVNMIDFLSGKDIPGTAPFASRLFSSEDRQGQSVSDFYNQKEQMGQAWTSAKKAHEAGDIIRARRILEDNAEVLGLNPARIALLTRRREWTIPDRMKRFNKVADRMSSIRKKKGENKELTALARIALGRN